MPGGDILPSDARLTPPSRAGPEFTSRAPEFTSRAPEFTAGPHALLRRPRRRQAVRLWGAPRTASRTAAGGGASSRDAPSPPSARLASARRTAAASGASARAAPSPPKGAPPSAPRTAAGSGASATDAPKGPSAARRSASPRLLVLDQSQEAREHIPGAGANHRRRESISREREPITGGERAYPESGSQSQEAREHIPRAGANRSTPGVTSYTTSAATSALCSRGLDTDTP
eukprot:1194395-Prorocentrum_minimum.AAC.5